MVLAKIFRHGGSQAVRIPKEFRLEGTSVSIERKGKSIILKPVPKPKFKTLGDIARYFRENRANDPDIPDIEAPPRPKEHERPNPIWW